MQSKITLNMRQDHVLRCLDRPQGAIDGAGKGTEDDHINIDVSSINNFGHSHEQDVPNIGVDNIGSGNSSNNIDNNSHVVMKSNKRPPTMVNEYDIMYIDDKDPDFASPPVQKKKSPKRPKGMGAKTFQGTLSVDTKGKMSVKKPPVETANNIESTVKVAPISKNLDGEISSLREQLGNIDEKLAVLERLKESTRNQLAKKLKQKAQQTAQTTVLDGCERRPLEAVMGVVFSNTASNNINNIVNNNMCSSHLDEEKVDNCAMDYKELDPASKNRLKAPLWELSKLRSTFDVVVEELDICTKNPVL